MARLQTTHHNTAHNVNTHVPLQLCHKHRCMHTLLPYLGCKSLRNLPTLCPARSANASAVNSAPNNKHRQCQCRVYRRSEEHTSELQALMRISYAVLCLN